MEIHSLQRWVMKMRPGRFSTSGLLHSDRCAVAVAPGGGTYVGSRKRIDAVREFVWALNLRNVWICHVDSRRDQHVPSLEEAKSLLAFDDGWLPANLDCQESCPGANTRTQAEWAVEKAIATEGVRHLITATAWYHNARWALTVAKVLHDRDVEDINLSVLPSPDHQPVGGTRVSQTVGEEIQRIDDYQKKGDVATYDIAKKYFEV